MVLPIDQPVTVDNAERVFAELTRAVSGSSEDVEIDLANLAEFDTAGLAVFHRLHRALGAENRSLTFRNAGERVRQFLALAAFQEPEREQPARRQSEFERIGNVALENFADAVALLGYIGRVTRAMLWGITHPRAVRWSHVALHVQETGANALPIVALLSVLVGLVIAFSSAIQLAQFGANIYIADLIGIGVTREIGPLLAAILLTARSGSAFAAEIGTQKISDEIDALAVMGLKPVPYLVIPRIVATMITLPLLTLFADFFGIAGGMLIGSASLDVTPTMFLARLAETLDVWDVFSGVFKSFFFAILIAGVGCYRGMETSGGAIGVGRSTTIAVVSGIFLLVIADSVFVILFQYLGLN
ncbi:MAG: putative phospholipid ABC transporter permease protein MlaE [Calditrichaeota bacterium]|nr:putative phospholipid ABC transporter permease protein MlaE [Calditrichota bacterium]